MKTIFITILLCLSLKLIITTSIDQEFSLPKLHPLLIENELITMPDKGVIQSTSQVKMLSYPKTAQAPNINILERFANSR